MTRFLVTLLISLAGGVVFTLIHSPLPWLLGPMVFAFIGTRAIKRVKPLWPSAMRNTAMIVIGYSLGLSFTPGTLGEMGRQLPTMLLMTSLLLLFCGIVSLFIARLSGQSLPTVLLGSIPGGLSQMIILGEETKGTDLTVITFLQVSRLMMIIFCVPQLVFSPLFGVSRQAVEAAAPAVGAGWAQLFPGIVPFAVVCVVCAALAQRIRFPAAYLLGPMIGTAVVHLTWLHGPALPVGILDGAQLLIGAYVGLMLKPESLANKSRVILSALVSSVVLIAGSLGLSALLAHMHHISAATAFLSMAPGGMDQMGIIAKEIDANIAIVSCYQLFRTWFIFFAVPPLLKLLFKRLLPKERTAAEPAATGGNNAVEPEATASGG
ncbi:AbrB family transcriptional regulator [Paenibacillus cymbidii]|uniref:AbrB family transcriptional regulator n=1 Tax=Paenibacillus cymbidii TaxID=1639034 RepID=UPI001081FF91|nr:AbrB family transcriptional regulator [Paenibacillus cymbidii]